MPQQFHILRCFNCETFQVHIVKKIYKWVCNMCGEKQSVKKVFGQGTGKECRIHVQMFNKTRILASPEVPNVQASCNEEENRSECFSSRKNSPSGSCVSKWNEFIPHEEEMIDNEDNMDPDPSKYTFEKPNKRKIRAKNDQNNTVTKKIKTSKCDKNIDSEILVDLQNNDRIPTPIAQKKETFKNEKKSKWNDYISDKIEIDQENNKKLNSDYGFATSKNLLQVQDTKFLENRNYTYGTKTQSHTEHIFKISEDNDNLDDILDF